LTYETDSTLQKPARRGLGWRIFFAGWTLFALWAVWWLWHRAGKPIASASWSVLDLGPGAAPRDRWANWLKLADLKFHRIYPCLLLAPYVAWVAWRFPWGRHQWRTSLPSHLAGCALFVISTHLVREYADVYAHGRHPVQVMVYLRAGAKSERAQGANRDSAPPKGTVDVPAPAWVTNGRAKQPPEVPLPDGGPDLGRDWITDERTTRLDPRAFGKIRARRSPVEDPFDLLSLFVYASLVGSVYTVQLHRESKERERRAEALEAQLTAARLSALQAQLNPHFLFNALNAISTLLVRDARAARDALASFSELLRLALCQSTQAEVTLREDLEFLRRYVEIQQTRLGDRLRYEEATVTVLGSA
jgi:Histidine kinase